MHSDRVIVAIAIDGAVPDNISCALDVLATLLPINFRLEQVLVAFREAYDERDSAYRAGSRYC